MVKKFLKIKSKGFTLIEVLVSLIIFSIIAGSALGIFASSIKSQRRVLAQQQLSDQASYFMERFSRIIRMAQKDLQGNCITFGYNYQTTTGSTLLFLDSDNKCHKFFYDAASSTIKEQTSENNTQSGFSNDPTKATSSLPLFSPDFKINSFKIAGSGWGQNDDLQPLVTIFIEIANTDNIKIKSQTTISQRNLDVVY